MEALSKLGEQGASLVWGPWLIALLFGTHPFLTVRTGFMQRHLGRAIKLSVSKEPGAPLVCALTGLIAAESKRYFSNHKSD
jgi:AGCS family alanine or glycine:cation symporter